MRRTDIVVCICCDFSVVSAVLGNGLIFFSTPSFVIFRVPLRLFCFCFVLPRRCQYAWCCIAFECSPFVYCDTWDTRVHERCSYKRSNRFLVFYVVLHSLCCRLVCYTFSETHTWWVLDILTFWSFEYLWFRSNLVYLVPFVDFQLFSSAFSQPSVRFRAPSQTNVKQSKTQTITDQAQNCTRYRRVVTVWYDQKRRCSKLPGKHDLRTPRHRPKRNRLKMKTRYFGSKR